MGIYGNDLKYINEGKIVDKIFNLPFKLILKIFDFSMKISLKNKDKAKEEIKKKVKRTIGRKEVYNLAKKLFNSSINSISDKNFKKSFWLSTKNDFDDFENDKKEFLDGNKDEMPILSYDVWEYTDKARDEEKYNEWENLQGDLLKPILEGLIENGYILECGGDWDDGYYDLKQIKLNNK